MAAILLWRFGMNPSRRISLAVLFGAAACSPNPYADINTYPQEPPSSPTSNDPVFQLGCYGTGLLSVALNSGGQIYVVESGFDRVVEDLVRRHFSECPGGRRRRSHERLPRWTW